MIKTNGTARSQVDQEATSLIGLAVGLAFLAVAVTILTILLLRRKQFCLFGQDIEKSKKRGLVYIRVLV